MAQHEIEGVLEHYRDLFYAAPIPYVVQGPQGMVDANSAAARALDAPREELLGSDLASFVPNSHRALYAEHQRAVLERGTLQSTELVLLKRSGVSANVRLRSVRAGLVSVHWRTVIVELDPRNGSAPDSAPEGSKRTHQPRPHSAAVKARILVVEDDPLMQDATRRTLEEAGYDVLVASSAAEALSVVEEQAGAVGLVLSDVGLPGPSGIELAQAVRDLGVEARLLLMSGYDRSALTRRYGLPADAALLQKPFRCEELIERVQSELRARSSEAGRLSER